MKLRQFLASASGMETFHCRSGGLKGFNRCIRRVLTIAFVMVLAFVILTHSITYVYQRQWGDFIVGAPVLVDDESFGQRQYYEWDTTSDFIPVSQDASGTSTEELCRSFPHHLVRHMVQPILKMGHTETRDKIEAQIGSVSACINDLLIFSDLEETLHGHQVIDVLTDMPAVYHFDNEDFVNYTRIRHQQHQAHDPGSNDTWTIDGWRLDKYKFLPMVERAWMMRPGKRWYFFYETDTYVVWDNVFRFLENINHRVPLYIGSASPGLLDDNEHPDSVTFFANGGPGFVLSRAAMKKLLHRQSGPDGDYVETPLSHRWLELLRNDPCGDSVLGWALHTVGIDLSGYWPLFNPHPLHSIPFGNDYWCQPVLTMHKTKPDDMGKLWRWEHSRRILERPLLYEDLYDFHHRNRGFYLQDWDNCCWGTYHGPNVTSFAECGKACSENEECFQYRYHLGKCTFMRFMRYGEARDPQIPSDSYDDQEWTYEQSRFMSGWVQPRIDAWIEERKCRKAQWVRPSLERIF
ncbi:hypothetical protein DL765_002656 [Monosporascus sp. GIB2]|nr:hypothetical protein DL765_002656 [Monosporascus sp. GIB2]